MTFNETLKSQAEKHRRRETFQRLIGTGALAIGVSLTCIAGANMAHNGFENEATNKVSAVTNSLGALALFGGANLLLSSQSNGRRADYKETELLRHETQ